MRFIDSVYETYAINGKQKHQSFSPTAAILAQYANGHDPLAPNSSYDESVEKPVISPLKIVDLDDALVRPPSEVEANRAERARNQIEPAARTNRIGKRLVDKIKDFYQNNLCGLQNNVAKICLIGGISVAILLTILLASILGPIRVPRLELSKGVQFKPLKGSTFITETSNRLVFDGVLTIRPRVYNRNYLKMTIDRIQVHGYYIIKGARRQSLKRNYIASGAHSLTEVPARSMTSLTIPMDIRYSSGKPASPIMLDILERYDEEKSLDIFFSFEINYRVGGRARKTTFAGKQHIESPFTALDIDRIRRNK